MTTQTIMLLIAAAIVALLVSLFQYTVKAKGSLRNKFLFAFLRFLSVFMLLVLLINPKITTTQIKQLKPTLALLSDNSKSIAYADQSENLKFFLKELSNDKIVNDKFSIEKYSFGSEFEDTTLSFTKPQTKLYEALTNVQKLHRKQNTAIILLTDGNQTYGNNYAYYKSKYSQPIYAVAFGDTITYSDVSIEKVNVNKYAYLGNEFPVEIIANYQGGKSTKQILTIKNKGKLVFKKVLNFDSNKNSHFVSTLLKATTAGVVNYEISLSGLTNERYLKNNVQTISVDVIDQRQDVLLVSDIKHPDIAAINRIVSSNKRNTFKIAKPTAVNNIEDYELVIAYQPTSSFKNILTTIENRKIPILIISGKHTDWNFINKLAWGINKQKVNQTEEIVPILNTSFESFNTDTFSVEKMPPLETIFGEVSIEENFEALFQKKIAGVETQQALLMFWDNKALLDGEGIWKWRTQDYKAQKNFDNIDGVFLKTFQFLANKKAKQRLLLDYERINYTNSPISIQANYFNKSFEFDDKQRLAATIKNKITGETLSQPFVLKSNFYELDVSNLAEGSYEFTVKVLGTPVQKSGYFSIIDFDIENQFNNSNIKDLNSLTSNNGGALFYKTEFKKLKSALVSNAALKPIQKSISTKIDLIDWQYLLGLLILIIALEWFLRKFSGLI